MRNNNTSQKPFKTKTQIIFDACADKTISSHSQAKPIPNRRPGCHVMMALQCDTWSALWKLWKYHTNLLDPCYHWKQWLVRVRSTHSVMLWLNTLLGTWKKVFSFSNESKSKPHLPDYMYWSISRCRSNTLGSDARSDCQYGTSLTTICEFWPAMW